jgi:hypothetical protein
MRWPALASIALVLVPACKVPEHADRWSTLPVDAGPCAVVPQQDDWDYVGTAFEPGREGEFDHLLWGGFGGAPIHHGDEVLFYYQGAEGYSDEQESVRFRSIGLATSVDGTTFAKDPASPVLEWRPSEGEEEGAASVGVGLGPDGDIVAFYGANTQEGPTTVNADGRWATSEDGRTFTDRGIALDHRDRRIPGWGDELFPVIAFFHDESWYVYYLPNGRPRGQLGVAWGPSPDALSDHAPVRSAGKQVLAWGMQSAVRLCGDRHALFLNRVREKTMTVHLLDTTAPDELSDPVAVYRFPATGEIPEFIQGAVLLDREAGSWYLYYRTGDRSRYDVRRAPLVTTSADPAAAAARGDGF